jgi:hypothetical protein
MYTSWTSQQKTDALTTNSLYKFENTASAFLTQLLKDEEVTGLLPLQYVLAVNVMITNQEVVSTAPTTFAMTSLVEFFYVGKEQIQDLSTLLATVVSNYQGSGLYELLSDIKLIDADAQDFVHTFTNPEGTDATRTVYTMHNDDTEYMIVTPKSTGGQKKGLIVFVVLLTMALFMVSSVLLWISGGCVWIKSSFSWYSQNGVWMQYGEKRDSDGNETVNTGSSGILGAASNDDEENKMPTGFSPTRGIYRDDSDMFSPLSNMSNTTDLTTTVNNNPLGIVSMRKLGAQYGTPEKRHIAQFAQISRLSYSSEKK